MRLYLHVAAKTHACQCVNHFVVFPYPIFVLGRSDLNRLCTPVLIPKRFLRIDSSRELLLSTVHNATSPEAHRNTSKWRDDEPPGRRARSQRGTMGSEILSSNASRVASVCAAPNTGVTVATKSKNCTAERAEDLAIIT